MLTILLEKLVFHAFHGVYDEERLLGNDFAVSTELEVDITPPVTALQQTVNYVDIYELIRSRMKDATPLLETLAVELVQSIGRSDDRIRSVSITIKKCSLPIEQFEGSISVRYKEAF